jgi:hypothetical protein
LFRCLQITIPLPMTWLYKNVQKTRCLWGTTALNPPTKKRHKTMN